jgi:hypothetical protein
MDILLVFDATGLDAGEYRTSIAVQSSDPFNPSVVVPIHMNVSGSAEVEGEGLRPLTYRLEQNYPNPFNPSTTIRYGLPSHSHVTLTVFNTLGQRVATLVEGEQEAGFHEAVFDASALASGVYLYRLTAGSFVETRKLVLVR